MVQQAVILERESERENNNNNKKDRDTLSVTKI